MRKHLPKRNRNRNTRKQKNNLVKLAAFPKMHGYPPRCMVIFLSLQSYNRSVSSFKMPNSANRHVICIVSTNFAYGCYHVLIILISYQVLSFIRTNFGQQCLFLCLLDLMILILMDQFYKMLIVGDNENGNIVLVLSCSWFFCVLSSQKFISKLHYKEQKVIKTRNTD